MRYELIKKIQEPKTYDEQIQELEEIINVYIDEYNELIDLMDKRSTQIEQYKRIIKDYEKEIIQLDERTDKIDNDIKVLNIQKKEIEYKKFKEYMDNAYDNYEI